MLFRSAPSLDRRLVAISNRQSFEAEQFRRLRHRLEELSITKGTKVVAVTSPASHDGKTLTAANLALSLSQARQARVLLIDADLRRPTVAPLFRMKATQGLMRALSVGGDMDGLLQRVPGATLDVLTCERRRSDTYDVLTSPAFATLLEQARRTHTMIVIDTPPIVPVPDANLLARLVDGYLLVVAANTTPRKLLGEALMLLEPSSVLGLVFNRDPRPFSGYYGPYFEANRRRPSDSAELAEA